MRIDVPQDRPRIEIPIQNGTAMLSPIIKTDRDYLAEGLEELSIQSRFTRFGQGLSHLTEKELDYLADVDQLRHVAWGAAIDSRIAGVGRYIITDQDDCPEVALTVIDEFQSRGVGSALFSALAAVARHDGLDELCFEATQENEAVRQLLKTYEVSPLASEGLIERRLRLTDVPTSPDDAGFVEVMLAVRSRR